MSVGNISLKKSNAITVTWDIPEFFTLPIDFGHHVQSSFFYFAEAKWCINLFPNGWKHYSTAVISINRLRSLMPLHKIDYKFDLTVQDEGIYRGRFSGFHFKENCEKIYLCLPERHILTRQRNSIAPNSCLRVVCYLLSEESSESVSEEEPDNLNIEGTLAQDMKNFLLNGQGHDLILKVKGKEFSVHRNILRARSEVFESMLSHDMKETNSGIVDVPDCEPEAMKQFLFYLYCDKIETLNEHNMLGLYYIADKYNAKLLKRQCFNFIRKSMTLRNICNIIQLALNHNDESLLKSATNFFANNTDEVLVTTEWMSFLKENVIVANEILIKASQKSTDESNALKKGNETVE